MLHLRRFGTGSELVALHGFSLTGEQFSPSAEPLGYTIVAPDLPGHGFSRTQPGHIDTVLSDIAQILRSPTGPRPLLGYSQGGRLALLAAAQSPGDISCLVLISATAGIRNRDERQTRIDQDAKLAERIETIGIDGFIDSWTTEGLTSLDQASTAYRSWDRSIRLENTSAGLASALRCYGQGAQPSIWGELTTLSLPVLLVVGDGDHKYQAVNREMADLIPGAELHVVVGARHNPMADRPEATYSIVSEFLSRHR